MTSIICRLSARGPWAQPVRSLHFPPAVSGVHMLSVGAGRERPWVKLPGGAGRLQEQPPLDAVRPTSVFGSPFGNPVWLLLSALTGGMAATLGHTDAASDLAGFLLSLSALEKGKKCTCCPWELMAPSWPLVLCP